MEKTAIKFKGETIGVFWFETEEKAKDCANDVYVFRKDREKAEEIMKKYKRIKPYSNFFRAFTELIEGAEKEE